VKNKRNISFSGPQFLAFLSSAPRGTETCGEELSSAELSRAETCSAGSWSNQETRMWLKNWRVGEN